MELRRAAARPSGAATSPPPSCCARPPSTGHAALGWADAGRDRGRRPRRPGDRAAGHACARPAAPPAAASSSRPRAADVTDVVVDGRAVVRDGRHLLVGRAGRSWPRRSRRCCAMSSLLIDNIGELVTNDPARRRARWASAATRRVRGRGRPGRLGRAGRARAGRRPAGRRRRARRCCPASWTATPTWSSPATGPPSSPRGWPASRTPAAASGPRWPPPGPPTDDDAARATSRRLRRRGAAAGHHHDRDQERVRADRRRRGPLAADRRASSPTETTFLGAHVVPAEYADRPDDYVDLVCGPMLAAAAPYARWVDVFCERGAFDADQARAVLHRRAWPPGCGRGCTPTSSAAGPGRAARGGARRGQRRPLHPPVPTPTSTRWPARDTVATLLPGAEFSTRSPYPDARRLLDAGRHRGAGDRLQPRLVVHLVDAVLRRAGRPRDADDARPRRCGRPPRAARGRCAATTSAQLRPGRARRPGGARRAVVPAPGLPAGGPPDPHTSCTTECRT